MDAESNKLKKDNIEPSNEKAKPDTIMDSEPVINEVDVTKKIDKPIPLKLTEQIGAQIGNSSFVQSIETGLSDLLRLVESSRINDFTPMIHFTRDIYHFYNIELIEFSATNHTKPVFIPDGAHLISPNEFGDYATSRYLKDGLHAGYLGIDFNDEHFPLQMSQTTPQLIKNSNSILKTANNNLITIPGSGVGAMNENETMVQLISSLMYVLCGCVSSYGNKFYIGDDVITKDNRSMSKLISNVDTIEMMNDNVTISSKSKTFFAGRLDNSSISNVLLSGMTGYIQNIDPNYQHNFQLLALNFPNTAVRERIIEIFNVIRPYGEITETSVSINAVKVQSTVVTDMDQTANALIANYSMFLTRNVIVPDLFIELLNSLVVKRDDFVNGAEGDIFFFSNYELVFDNYFDLADFSFFPTTDNYKQVYNYARKIPPVIASEYANVYNMTKTTLSLFPFMLYSESLSQVSQSSVTSQFSMISSIISTITSMTSDVSPEILSKFVAYDMMAHYVDIQSSPVRFTEGRSRPQFALDLIGLLLEKFLFPNLYKRNVHLWVSKCCEFYKMYFIREYSAIFNIHYYGYYEMDGIRISIKNITGFSKRTAGNVTWTVNMDPIDIGLTALFRSVWNLLRLNNNVLSYERIIDSPYRVSRRTAVIPGRCYIPLDKSMSYPLSEILLGAIDITRTYNPVMSALPKSTSASYDILLTYYNAACYSIGAWFHCVYCPVYLSTALHPTLTCNDIFIELAPHQFYGYYDDILNHNPAFTSGVPHKTPIIIQIPGINSTIFGDELSKQIRRLFFVARLTTYDYQGMTSVTANYDDLDIYSVLYSGANTKTMVNEYTNQLVKRQQVVEIEILTSLVTTSTLPMDDNIKETIRRANLMGGVTAASFARLRDTLSKEKYNAFNLLNFSPLSNNLEDPRIYRPAYCTTDWRYAIINTLQVLDQTTIRPHVLDNFRIVTNAMYGPNHGIKRINIGISLSTITINNLSFATRHRRSPVRIYISESQRMTTFENMNYSNGYVIRASYADREVTRILESANEVKGLLRDLAVNNIFTYEIVITRRFIETHGLTFLTQVVNDGCSTIVVEDVATVPYYVNQGSNFANQSDPINSDTVRKFVANSKISLTPIQQTTVAQETFTPILTSLVRHVLPLEPMEPHVIFQNFHIPMYSAVDASYFPVVDPRRNEPTYDRIIDGDVSTVGITTHPYGLLSSTIVYRVLPRYTIPVLQRKI